MVWAKDPVTGELALKQVLKTYERASEELIHIHVNGEEIITTPEHPFYHPIKGWTNAVHLRAGDLLVLRSGEYVVIEQVAHEILESPVKVYNFEVEDFHTYYVGNRGVFVHNKCDIVSTRDLIPTHSLTNSRRQMNTLINDIKVNGIKEPIKYVDLNGTKYIVDGHHRVAAAKVLGMKEVIAEEVKLPYAGYKTNRDLFW